jgi:hypothetical protein
MLTDNLRYSAQLAVSFSVSSKRDKTVTATGRALLRNGSVSTIINTQGISSDHLTTKMGTILFVTMV